MADDLNDDLNAAKQLLAINPEALKSILAWIDPDGDGVVTKQEMILNISKSVDEYLRSDEGKNLTDKAQLDNAVQTFKNAPGLFRKALGKYAPKIENISDDEAKEAAQRVLDWVHHGRERTL